MTIRIRPMSQDDIFLALNTFETFRSGDGIVSKRSLRRKIAKIGVISPPWRKYGCAFFRSENSKRSKEIKLCIVYAHIHAQPSSFSHHIRASFRAFAFAKRLFRSDFETRSRIQFCFVRGAIAGAPVLLLIPGGESHVTTY